MSSDDNKQTLMFIHFPKCAGMGMRKQLRARFNEKGMSYSKCASGGLRSGGVFKDTHGKKCQCVVPKVVPGDYLLMTHHSVPLQIDLSKFVVVTCVRNPFSWYVSYYFYLRERAPRTDHMIRDNFSTWLNRRAGLFTRHVKDLWQDSSGNELVNIYLRFEHIDHDLATHADVLGNIVLKHRTNTSKHRPFNTYYTKTMRELVHSEDAEAFRMFPEYRWMD